MIHKNLYTSTSIPHDAEGKYIQQHVQVCLVFMKKHKVGKYGSF